MKWRAWTLLSWFVSVIFLQCGTLVAQGIGMVIACNDHYARNLFANLSFVRTALGCRLPVEIWYAGDELSLLNKSLLQSLGKITFHDIAEILGGNPEKYRGYHIKGLALAASTLDEIILADADLFFFQSPTKLLKYPRSREYGALFFRDREEFCFQDYQTTRLWYHDRHYTTSFTYAQRKKIVRHLIPKPNKSIPSDWQHYWEEDSLKLKFPLPSEHQDAGCIYIDKRRHQKGSRLIGFLNQHHELFDRYFLGDKETYWIALAASGEGFYVNPCHPFRLRSRSEYRDMIHYLDSQLFFMQKTPIHITTFGTTSSPTGHLYPKLSLSLEELRWIDKCAHIFQHYLERYDQKIAQERLFIGGNDETIP